MLRTMTVTAALFLSIATAFAEPVNKPFVPAPWPDLRQNSDEPPSCVFGSTLGPGNSPAYFCAVIIRSPVYEATLTAQGAIVGLFVNPTNGAITPIPPLLLTTAPRAVGCVLVSPGTPNCLFYPARTVPSNADVAVGLAVFSAGSLVNNTLANLSTPPIQEPPKNIGGSPLFQSLISNFSCVNRTCFVVDNFTHIRQWTFDNGQWTTPQDLSGIGIASPALPLDPSLGRQTLSCTSSSPAASTTPKFDCFVRASLATSSLAVGNLFHVGTDGSAFSAKEGFGWLSGSTVIGGPTLKLGTAPGCLSAKVGASECFFGFIPAPSSPKGLGSVPDDGTRPASPVDVTQRYPQGAILQRGTVSVSPSCVTFSLSPSPGAFECAFDYKSGVDGNDIPTGDFSDATIFLATTNALPPVRLESLGVAAPSQEWSFSTINGRLIAEVVSRPKAVKSLTCTKGPDFQSLCVAAVVESASDPFATVTAAGQAFERKKYRLVYKLVGEIGVAPAPPPPTVIHRPPKKGVGS